MNILDCPINPSMMEWLNWLWFVIRTATPILMVVLITVDMVKAMASSKEDEMKHAQQNAIKRILIGVIIFFVPTLINLLLNIVDGFSGGCGIGW